VVGRIDDGPWPGQVRFRPARALTVEDVAAIGAQVRVLCSFARSALVKRDEAREMLSWENSGFSVEATVRRASFCTLAALEPDVRHTPIAPRESGFLPALCLRKRPCLNVPSDGSVLVIPTVVHLDFLSPKSCK